MTLADRQTLLITPKMVGIETEYGVLIHTRSYSDPASSSGAGFISPGGAHLGQGQAGSEGIYPPRGQTGHQAFYGLGGGWYATRDVLGELRVLGCQGEYGGDDYFLPNGSRVYNDHSHVEYSTAETLSARRLVALVKAGEALLNQARKAARDKLSSDRDILIIANNSDGKGNSYASHLNILLSRRAFDEFFRRRPHVFYMYLVPHLVTSIIYTGAGKVGSENGLPEVGYQISQRADFIETAAISLQTTYQRPLINSRDEPLADPTRFARMHLITFDTNMQEIALFLKVGTTQLVLAMIEAGFLSRLPGQGLPPLRVGELTLRDPVKSMQMISRDLTLKRRLELEGGRSFTALEIQEALLEAAERFVETGECVEIVPDAERILKEWRSVLNGLRKHPNKLYDRIDWIAKLLPLSLQRRKLQCGWEHPSLRMLDIQYANIDPEQGLYFTLFLKHRLTKRVTTNKTIRFYMENAPEDSRAFLRGECIRRFSDRITEVDWQTLRFQKSGGFWPRYIRLRLDDPLRWNREQTQELLEQVGSPEDFLEVLEGELESFGPKSFSCSVLPGGAGRSAQ